MDSYEIFVTQLEEDELKEIIEDEEDMLECSNNYISRSSKLEVVKIRKCGILINLFQQETLIRCKKDQVSKEDNEMRIFKDGVLM